MGRNRLKLKLLKPDVLLFGVFIFALLIRLLYIRQIISTPVFNGLVLDVEQYDNFAIQVLKGNFTHKDFIYLNPFYSFFLAFVYLIFGQSHLAAVIIQAVIDSISCLIIYYVASTLLNKKIGIIAAITYACYGMAIFYTGILLASTEVVFLILLFVSSLLFAEENNKPLILFISGVLFGLVVLARPNVILFLFFLPVWFFVVARSKLGVKRSVCRFLLLLLGLFTVISLISIRNYSIERRLSPFSVQGGFNFYIGNNPGAKGLIMSPRGIANSPVDQIKTSIHYAEKELGRILTPSQASRYWFSKGLMFVRNNPTDALFLYVNKFALFWRHEEAPLNINYAFAKTFAPIFRLPFISFGIIAPFAILGMVLAIKRKENVLLIILFMFSYMISVIIFFVSARYRFPIVPFLIICSSYVLYHLVKMLRAKELRHLGIAAAFLVPLFVGINKNFKMFEFVHDHVWTHNSLGVFYYKKGALDEAIAEYRKALSLDPNDSKAHFNLGLVYHDQGRSDEAIVEYRKALSINPNHPEAHFSLGLVCDEQGRLDEAIIHYKRALFINPDHIPARINLGIVYGKKGMLEESISEFKMALSKDPNSAEAHYNLGLAYHEQGRLDEAIIEYKRVLTISPDDVRAHINLSAVYSRKNMFADSYYHRGLGRYAIGEYGRALDDIRTAQSLGRQVDLQLLEDLRKASGRQR